MSRFRPPRHELPGLNLAAMPDLIFTVLFFFMIVTHMRQVTPRVHADVPQGTELQERVNKNGMIYIFVGHPTDAGGRQQSDKTVVQLNDKFVTVGQIANEVALIRQQMSDDERQRMVVSIRADRNTDMGTVNSIKQQLRKAGALNINYSATKTNKDKKRK